MPAKPLAGDVVGSPESDFLVAEWVEPAPDGAPVPIAPLHVHHVEDEAWYVLEGTLGFRLGDEELEVPAGSAVFGPRGVAHSFWNAGPGPARYVVVMRPKTYELIKELHALENRDRDALAALYGRHGCDLLE